MNKESEIRNIILETLKQYPQGITPRELYQKLDKLYSKMDLQQVLSVMWQENHSIIGSDRKLRYPNQ